MGIAIREVIESEPITIEQLAGKTLAVDGYNILYQFLTTIRGPDGSPLTDSSGNVTSHLTGLFARTTHLLSKGIKLIFVFDGKPPELKRKELDRRRALKQDAAAKFESAKDEQDVEGMRKFAARTTKLTPQMVGQAQQLLDALGVPWIEAPSEGEAQAAALVSQGHAWAIVSQDADALMYAAPRIVRNLAVTGKRKQPGKLSYASVEPELVEYKKVLASLEIDLQQLRALGLLIGTDYNIGGVKGIGPKKGLKLVKEFKSDLPGLFASVHWDEHVDVSWQQILDVFEHMPTIDPGPISFGKVDPDAVRALLIEKHDFSEARIAGALEKLQSNVQRGLGEFF